jgi:hypothetical protein
MVPSRALIHPKVRFIANQEGAVLLHLERGRYESLNGAGAAIWSDLMSGASSEEIVSHVCLRFPQEPHDRVESDVARFLSDLASHGLVTLEPLP